MSFEKLVLNLPETAVELFVQFAGPKSLYIGQSFETAAENEAAKVITRAMKLHHLKIKDADSYPHVFGRYKFFVMAIKLGVDEVKSIIVAGLRILIRSEFEDTLSKKYHDVNTNSLLVSQILSNLKKEYVYVSSGVFATSLHEAMQVCNRWLEEASLEAIILHLLI